jgi:single-strand DNA-binding protein
MNKVVLMGRLTRDPNVRYSQNEKQTAVARMTIAVDRRFKREGEPDADFISCVAWRHTGEFISRYFAKGRMIVVDGHLEMRDWTDKEGNKRTAAEVNVENAYFADSKRSDGGAPDADTPGNWQPVEDPDAQLPF